MKRSRLLLVLMLASITAPVFAATITVTFEVDGLDGLYCNPIPGYPYTDFYFNNESKALTGTFTHANGVASGDIPAGAVTASVSLLLGDHFGGGLKIVDASGDTVIEGNTTSARIELFEGRVTITSALEGMNRGPLFQKDAFDGILSVIPDHDQFLDATVEFSFSTTETSVAGFLGQSGFIPLDASMKITFTANDVDDPVIPEPATALLMLAGAGWLARRRRS